MRIAVSTSEPTLDAEVDPRFGRCRYFIIVDTDSMEFETVENSGALAGGGAGIATAQVIVDKGIEAVLTGNCGPNAFQVLSAAEIKVVTGVSGKVRAASSCLARRRRSGRGGRWPPHAHLNRSDCRPESRRGRPGDPPP